MGNTEGTKSLWSWKLDRTSDLFPEPTCCKINGNNHLSPRLCMWIKLQIINLVLTPFCCCGTSWMNYLFLTSKSNWIHVCAWEREIGLLCSCLGLSVVRSGRERGRGSFSLADVQHLSQPHPRRMGTLGLCEQSPALTRSAQLPASNFSWFTVMLNVRKRTGCLVDIVAPGLAGFRVKMHHLLMSSCLLALLFVYVDLLFYNEHIFVQCLYSQKVGYRIFLNYKKKFTLYINRAA